MRELMVRDLFGAVDQLFNFEAPRSQQSNMRVDIKEDDKQFTLVADLPGVNKENIKVKFEKGYLTISVEASINDKKEGERFIRVERHSAIKSRSFFFDDKVNTDDIKAQYKDGVLTLEVPKKEQVITVKDITVE